METKFIDIHSHLDMCENIPEIVETCNEKKIKIVTCGVNPKINRKTLKLEEKYPEIEICLGVYPVDSFKLSEKKIQKEINFVRDKRDKIFGWVKWGWICIMINLRKNMNCKKGILKSL